MTGERDVRGLTRAKPAAVQVPMPARRWRTRILLPAGIVAAMAGLLLYATWDTLVPATPVRAVPVVVKAVTGASPGTVTVQAPGWLEPDPHAFYVPALTDGVVAELLVLEGERVEAGGEVARLIDDDAKLARMRAAALVAERSGAVAVAEAEVAAARTTLETLVDRTEAVARARAEQAGVVAERARLDAEIQAAEAVALATADELRRKAPLVPTRAVSEGEVERLRLRLLAERAALAARRAGIPVLEARHVGATARLAAAERHTELLIEERRDLARAEARLTEARAAERTAEAGLAEADLRLARMRVRSPTAGIVMRRLVSPGSRVQVSSDAHSAHVVHLYDPEKLQVRVDVPLVDAARVGVDQRAEIVVDALPDRVFEGVVTRLVHLADVAKNTVEVKVRITDPEPVLKPEMLARVRFLASGAGAVDAEARQRVFVPLRAVADGRVLVVTGQRGGRGRVGVRDVTLGSMRIEDHVEVVSGLSPGDLVIVDAPADLAEGARVAITGGGR